MLRPLPSPRMITEADEAILWLRWFEADDMRNWSGSGRTDGVEADHLAVRRVPGSRRPALTRRVGGDRLAAQLSEGADTAVDGVLNW